MAYIQEQHDKVAEESVTVHHDQTNLSAKMEGRSKVTCKLYIEKLMYSTMLYSTIRSLEEELRRLQLTCNRTFNMSTNDS